ncbi:MAG: hypothetical protein E6K94_03815 [Thaumarchaeota archaeon]|nr:MAG: hypothetical protein E6K94_03815 [Nitrososphaerota archaeon]
MSDGSNAARKVVSTHYNPVTKVTTITYNDGSQNTLVSEGRSLAGAVTATSSSISRKMKRENNETEENTENIHHSSHV